MDEDEEMAELRAQEARRVREEAKKCLRHASFQLGKAAYEIDEYLKEFSTARIPIRRQVILNEAMAHLVANVLPNLGIAEMASSLLGCCGRSNCRFQRGQIAQKPYHTWPHKVEFPIRSAYRFQSRSSPGRTSPCRP